MVSVMKARLPLACYSVHSKPPVCRVSQLLGEALGLLVLMVPKILNTQRGSFPPVGNLTP